MEKDKKEEAIKLFEKEEITIGQAAKKVGMDLHQFQLLLSSRRICVHYGIKEFNEDLEVLKRLNL